MKKILFFITCGIFTAANAQIGGNYSFNFLNLAENAKVAALGGELISGFDSLDVNSGSYNPANIQESHANILGINFLPLKQGIKKSSISYTHNINKLGAVNFGIQHIGYGDIQSTDILGNDLGTINPQEYAISIGKSFTQRYFRMGTALKFAGSNLGAYNSHALMLDLGGTFVHPKKQLTASLLFKNMGFAIDKYTKGSDFNLPFQVVGGLTFKPEHMPMRFSFTGHNLQAWDVQYLDPTNTFTIDNDGNKIAGEKQFSEKLFRHLNVGTEFLLGKNLNLRMGYNHMRRKELKGNTNGGSGFSFGAMVRIKRINFEFTKSYYFAGSGSAVLSVSTNLFK